MNPPRFFNGGPKELMEMLAQIEEANRPEYEADGEIICLLKNYPTLQGICEDGQKHKKMLEEKHDMIVARAKKQYDDVTKELNEGSAQYWERVGKYCEEMNLYPPEFNTKDYGIDIENGAVVIKKRIKYTD